MAAGFLLDLNRCTGCDACRLGCTIENGLSPEVSWREVYTFNSPRFPTIPVYHLSLACNHCADAPCMTACPTLAYSRDGVTEAVILDAESCIGCGYCAWACPFDAPRYDSRAGVMTKCTLCNPRLHEGLQPACTAACPTDALRYGDLDTAPGGDRVPGFPSTDVGPAIRFAPLERAAPPEGRGESTEVRLAALPESGGPAGIRLATEWPLAIFTLLAAGLFGWLAAFVVASVPIVPAVYLGGATVGAAASTLHLGRKLGAWRAVRNLRGSWLSREIVGYSAFVAASAISLLGVPGSIPARWAAVVAGLACLYCIDRVYDLARGKDRLGLHSADVLLTGLFIASALAVHPVAVALLGGAKAALYIARKRGGPRALRRAVSWPGAIRLGAGFALPFVVWILAPSGWPIWALAGIAVGEIVDRCEFYLELEIPGPRARIAADLRAMLTAG